jgi:hypothetical protein
MGANTEDPLRTRNTFSAKGLSDFFTTYQTWKNIPNNYNIYQVATKYSKWPKIYQNLTLQVPKNTKKSILDLFGVISTAESRF